MNTLMRRALTPLAVLLLAACGAENSGADSAGPPEPSSRTLAATLTAEDALGTSGAVMNNAGLADVLAGVGPYTVFAPGNAAFTAAGADFADAAMKAQAAALMRAHIVPGVLTRGDIEAALTKAADGKVQMRTMADGLLTFTREGTAVVVTAEDGAQARLTGDEMLAQNGVVQPVDGLLVKATAPAD